jgi:hypothetical protein
MTAAAKKLPEPTSPAAPEPSRVDDIFVNSQDQLFCLADGVIYQRVEGPGQAHLPQSRRKPAWDVFPSPHGWQVQRLIGAPNGSMYCLAEQHLFAYGRTNAQVGTRGELFSWVELPLPIDAVAEAEAAKPQPEFVHACVGLPGMSVPFSLDEGTFVLQVNSNVATVVLERSVGAGVYRTMPLGPDRRFSLPARSFVRVYSPNCDGVDVFKLPPEG